MTASCLTSLCGNEVVATNTAAHVATAINAFLAKAEAAEGALTTLINALDTSLEGIEAPSYNPSVDGSTLVITNPTETMVRGDYASLQPTVVTLPARGGLLSNSSAFTRLDSRVSNAVAVVDELVGTPATMGLVLSTEMDSVRQVEADLVASQSEADAAGTQAALLAAWAREDTKTVAKLELQNYSEQWTATVERLKAEEDTLQSKVENYKAQLKKEAERRNWSKVQIGQLMKEAEMDARFKIEWGEVMIKKLMQVEEIGVRMKSAVAHAWIQGAYVRLSFGGSQSVTAAE